MSEIALLVLGAPRDADGSPPGLVRALRDRLGSGVDVREGSLSDAGTARAILAFRQSHAELDALPPEACARLLMVGLGSNALCACAERYGIAGGVEVMRYHRWTRDRAPDPTRRAKRAAEKLSPWSSVVVRSDVAARMGGLSAPLVRPAGYVVAWHPRRLGVDSVLAAAVASLLGVDPPAPEGQEHEPPFPIGRTVEGYTITRAIHGDCVRGLFGARSAAREHARFDDAYLEGGLPAFVSHAADIAGCVIEDRSWIEDAYVSVGTRQTVPLRDKLAALALPEDGFAPILAAGRLVHPDGGAYDALVEGIPRGAPLSDLLRLPGLHGAAPPLDARRAARLLLPFLDWVESAHRAGRVIGGLRPELLFGALQDRWPDDDETLLRPEWSDLRPRATGIVPRCEPFLRTAELPCSGWTMPFGQRVHLAPEGVAGRPLTPSADVFSFGVVLAACVGGAYPFPGDSMVDKLNALMTGAWTRVEGPPALLDLLDDMLAPDPGDRPSVPALRARLAVLAGWAE